MYFWATVQDPFGSLMRVVSMDEASNLFRACFCHGDASPCYGDASIQNAQEMQKT